MFRFENESYLLALLLIPLLIILYFLARKWRASAIKKFGESKLVSRLLPDYSQRRQRAKFILYLLAFAAIVVALANPQIGTKLETVKRKGIDVMVAIDVSKSMMADDIKPSRLERAKQILSKLIERMKDDRIGIIVFAGNAYLQMPLSSDYTAAKLFLQTINTDVVPTQGTAVGDAIELAISSYEEGLGKNKALVIISDGENHEEGAMDMAKRALDEGLIVYTLGIGSEQGSPIPEIVNGRKVGYKRDKSGQTVVSKLNQTMLKDLARTANGKYFHIRGAKNEIAYLLDELGSIEKRDFEDKVFTDYSHGFQYFIALALLFVFLEFLISERRSGWFSKWSLFGEEAT